MNKHNAHLYLPLVQALAEGKTIQVQDLFDSQWDDDYDFDFSLEPDCYRVKPWSLSRHLPGFRALRDGEEYHRQDWTEEMLPEGCRPLLKGEYLNDGDQYKLVHKHDTFDVQDTVRTGDRAEEYPGFWRTTRPLPEPVKHVPLDPSDWMKGGPWWVRGGSTDNRPVMVVEALPDGGILYGQTWNSSSETVMSLERSNDGINWSKCHKPA
jgi:hypothetical protein